MKTSPPAVELVDFLTADSVQLHGAWHARSGEPKTAADAAVFLHGAGSNFYSSTLLAGLLPALLDLGLDVLAVNTRGHDTVCTLKSPDGGRRGGLAYEVVDDCRHDVHAAVDHLAARGCQRVVLIGHSLGALKALYSQAYAPHKAVSAVIAISPPRLSYKSFCQSDRRDQFLQFVAEAERQVAAGRPEALIEVTIPLQLVMTAAGYIDKYGPAERYDMLRFAHLVPCPALFTFGSLELESGNPAFTAVDRELVERAADAEAPLDIAVVAEADHFYAGCVSRLLRTLKKWPGWQRKDP